MSEHDLLGDNCDDPYCAHLARTELSDDERDFRAQHPRPRVGPRHRVRRPRWVPPVEAPMSRAITLSDLAALGR